MDFTSVTETPGSRVRVEALAMLYTRYAHAATFCCGNDVLEVGCGAGQGLGYLASRGARVVGADYSERLLAMAARQYRGRLPLVRLDAHALPFRDGSFDVVVLFEAIYYLADVHRFVSEARRLLRNDGVLLICTVNKDWPDFNPSPFSTAYLTAGELVSLLAKHGFDVSVFGSFHDTNRGARATAISAIRRLAVALHLIPQSMKGKAWLKRLFYGRLAIMPAEIADGQATLFPLQAITTQDAFPKVLHAVARAR